MMRFRGKKKTVVKISRITVDVASGFKFLSKAIPCLYLFILFVCLFVYLFIYLFIYFILFI